MVNFVHLDSPLFFLDCLSIMFCVHLEAQTKIFKVPPIKRVPLALAPNNSSRDVFVPAEASVSGGGRTNLLSLVRGASFEFR